MDDGMSFKVQGHRVYAHSQSGFYFVELKRGTQRSLKTKDKRVAIKRAKGVIDEYDKDKTIQIYHGENITLIQLKEEYITDPDRGGLSPHTLRNDELALRLLGMPSATTLRFLFLVQRLGTAKSPNSKRCVRPGM